MIVDSLKGLTMLSDSVAEGLGNGLWGRCGKLVLDGLTSITDSVARALANHHGPLSLNGLM